MHLRRALLLFAIVLGFAAVAASIAPPPTEDAGDQPTSTEPPPPPPADEPQAAAGPPEELRFVTGQERPERRTIRAGDRAVVTVAVEGAGQVAIQGLGLLQAAEPGTPARFDVLVSSPGRYEVTFQPVDGQPERIGIIEVDRA